MYWRDIIKKTTKIWTYVQIIGRYGISEPYFFQKEQFGQKCLDMVVHTNESMQNTNHGEGSDLFPEAQKEFLFIHT